MINCSVDRGRFIVRDTPPILADSIRYTVEINDSPAIFEGKCGYFGGDLEIDCTDWMDQWITGRSGMGVLPVRCKVSVYIYYYQEGELLTVRAKSIDWWPTNIDVPMPEQSGLICGGCNGWLKDMNEQSDSVYTIAVYPIFFFRMSYTIDNNDYVDDNVMFDPYSAGKRIAEPGKSFITYPELEDSGKNHWSDVNNWVVKTTDYTNLYDIGTPYYRSPKLLFHDGSRINQIDFEDVYGDYSLMQTIEPIFMKTDMQDIRDELDWQNGSYFRYTQDELDAYYEQYIKDYIDQLNTLGTYVLPIDLQHHNHRTMDNINVELVGYGYKTLMLYSNAEDLISDWDTVDFVTMEYISCRGFGNDCSTANLVLVDSEFSMTANDTGFNPADFTNDDTVQESYTPSDVIIPLTVKNNMLKGKTIDNLNKITYMDRYGDTHNSLMSNKYEVECFIDPEWLSVKSGDDINYSKLMLACQGARKAYLCCNMTGISGVETTGSFVVEGRVKDVEKIETWSTYSSGKKTPNLKITFEFYK